VGGGGGLDQLVTFQTKAVSGAIAVHVVWDQQVSQPKAAIIIIIIRSDFVEWRSPKIDYKNIRKSHMCHLPIINTERVVTSTTAPAAQWMASTVNDICFFFLTHTHSKHATVVRNAKRVKTCKNLVLSSTIPGHLNGYEVSHRSRVREIVRSKERDNHGGGRHVGC
jgi:hypothetical protein